MRALGRALCRWLRILLARLARLINTSARPCPESKSSSYQSRSLVVFGDVSFDCIESSLLALPAELRNCVWELAFTPDTKLFPLSEHGDVDLLNAKGPSSNLLLVCKQVYHEARGLFLTAVPRYWRETRFFIHCGALAKQPTSKGLMERLSTIDDLAISNIQHLTICGPTDKASIPTLQLHGNIWRLTSHRPGTQIVTSQYLTLVNREYWNITFDYRMLLLKRSNYDAVKGTTLHCTLWATPGSDPEKDDFEAFHMIRADISDHNLRFIRIISDEMEHKVLTKEEMRGVVRSHIQMAQQS